MANSVHKGHRDRVRNDFLENGFSENTPPHKIIEMLLFYSIPRKDTNSIAHEMIAKFGSISGIIDADPRDLERISGVNSNSIALLKLIIPIARIYMTDKCTCGHKFDSIDEICHFLLKKYFGYNNEVFSLTTFNSGGKMLGCDVISKGNVCSVGVSTREVVETVLKRNATCAIISHNHPGGIAIPSAEDVKMTETLQEALKHIGVRLLDHIIIADRDYVSLAQSQQYEYIFR